MRRTARRLNYFTNLQRRGGLPNEVIGRNAHLRPGEKWIPGVGYVSPRANDMVTGEMRGPSIVQSPSAPAAKAQAQRFVVDNEVNDFVTPYAPHDISRPESHGESALPIPADGRSTVDPNELKPLRGSDFETLEPLTFGLPSDVAVNTPSTGVVDSAAPPAPSAFATGLSMRQRLMNQRRAVGGSRADTTLYADGETADTAARPQAPSLAEASRENPIVLGDDDFDIIPPMSQSRSSAVGVEAKRPAPAVSETTEGRPVQRLDIQLSSFWRGVHQQLHARTEGDRSDEGNDTAADGGDVNGWHGIDAAVLEEKGPERDAIIMAWLKRAGPQAASANNLRRLAANRLSRGMWRDALAMLDVVAAHHATPAPSATVNTDAQVAAMLFEDDVPATPPSPAAEEEPSSPPDSLSPQHGAVMALLHEILAWSKQQASVPLAMLAAGTASQGGFHVSRREYNAVLSVCAAAGDVATASRVLAQLMDEAIEVKEGGGVAIRPVDDDGRESAADIAPSSRSFRHCVVAAANAGDWKAACAFVEFQLVSLASEREQNTSSVRADDDTAVVNDSVTKAASACVEGGDALQGFAMAMTQATRGNMESLKGLPLPESVFSATRALGAQMERACVTPTASDTTVRVLFRGLAAAFGDRDFDEQLALFRGVWRILDDAQFTPTSRRFMHAAEDAMLVLNGIVEGAGDDEWTAQCGVWMDALRLLNRCVPAPSAATHVAVPAAVGVSAKMLSAAMHHANCSEQWSVAAALYETHMANLAPPHRLDSSDREAMEPDPTGPAVMAYALARGHDALLPTEKAELEWRSRVMRTAVPPRKSPWQLDLDACLHQYFRAATIAAASNAASSAAAPIPHPLVDSIVANFPSASWRTATLPSYLALLHEANRHHQVIAAYHLINDDHRIYTDGVMNAVVNRHGDGGSDDAGDQDGARRRPKRELPSPRAKALEGSRSTAAALMSSSSASPRRDLSFPTKLPTVSLNAESLAVVIDSCRSAGKWRLAIQCVEWMANCNAVQRSMVQQPEGAAFEAGASQQHDMAALSEDLQAAEDLLARAVTTVKACCVQSGYAPAMWRVPHEVP